MRIFKIVPWKDRLLTAFWHLDFAKSTVDPFTVIYYTEIFDLKRLVTSRKKNKYNGINVTCAQHVFWNPIRATEK